MLGFKSGQELIDIVGNAKAVVLPSEWYENGPYSAIEALQLSRPIIGADIGGIPELVDGNGYLFESGNIKELNNIIGNIAYMENVSYHQMKKKSNDLFDKSYKWKRHFEKLDAVYKKALRK